jgi:hypothetical protein
MVSRLPSAPAVVNILRGLGHGGREVHNEKKIDEVVLALLHLTAFPDHGMTRAWKGFDWDVLNRLHEAGMISDPRTKARSVLLTEEGANRARELFERYFAVSKEP